MKLMVAEKPIAERAEAQEIAETLEEIIQALVAGKDTLPPRAKYGTGNIVNKVLQQKQEVDSQMKDKIRGNSEERKKRSEEIKKLLEEHKEAKKKERQETKGDRTELKKKEKDEEQKLLDKEMHQYELKKKKVESKKQKEMSELQTKEEQLEEQKKKEKEEFESKNKDFLKNRKKEIVRSILIFQRVQLKQSIEEKEILQKKKQELAQKE